MATNKRLQYGALYDLIDTTVADKNNSVFNTYKPKATIGKEIFKELYKRFQSNPKKGNIGFYMDNSNQIGILSQCQSLQALLLLASDFNLTFDDAHIISETEDNLTIREIMDMVIEDIFERIKTDTPHVYRFDASPYETALFTAQYSNIEAITWVIPCFLQALKYHAEIGETCKWETDLVDVISYGLKYINDSFIRSENMGKSDRMEIGWNFTKDCQEPSLYFSFAVCECFVDFFSTFENYLTYQEAKRNENNYSLPIPNALVKAHEKHEKDREALTAKGDRGYNRQGKKLAQFDEYNELVLRYREINNGVDGITGSLYGEFEQHCKDVAKEIWRLTKDTLADHFYYNDLHTTLSEEDIAMATTSDALFNTVYIINIMLDAGLDEDLILQKEIAVTEDAVKEAEQEYNNLLDVCQLASQKAFRAYEKLKKIEKDYIVDQFLVGFNETFTVHKELIKELRKRRMRVFSLMPLLIRTNNAISEYLIKYPQVNMKKYLGYILDNRYVENGKPRWIWELEGYFSCSNYYYVSALGEFYAYYEQYESEYIPHYNENLAQREAIIEEQKNALESPTGEIGELKRKLDDRDKEIERLTQSLNDVKTPVEDAVAAVVASEMEKLLPRMLCEFMLQSAAGLTVNEIDPTLCNEHHAQFSDAFEAFIFAVMSKHIHQMIHTGKLSKEEYGKKYAAFNTKMKKDIIRCLKMYIAEINDSNDGRSSFYNS